MTPETSDTSATGPDEDWLTGAEVGFVIFVEAEPARVALDGIDFSIDANGPEEDA